MPFVLSRSIGGADRSPARFVTQSHALGGPIVHPGALLIAAAIAVVVVMIGRRLSA